MSLNVTKAALDVTGFCKIYYNQQEKDKDRGLKPSVLFDAGDDVNAQKTEYALQISGLPQAGAVWKKIL